MDEECYVCEKSGWTIQRGTLRDAPTVGVRRCDSCGVITPTIPHGVKVDYSVGTMHGGSLKETDLSDPVKSSDLERRYLRIVELHERGSILEIGCGVGDLLLLLKNNGIRSFGVDLDPSSRLLCENKGVLAFGSLSDALRGQAETVSTCVMFHVLEHLPDPRSYLQALVSELPNLETVVVEVPCAEDPLISLYESHEFSRYTYWSHHEHLHSHKSLSHLLLDVMDEINVSRIQRYGLANHVGWLVEGSPGGHRRFGSRFSERADDLYRNSLIQAGFSDTLWGELYVRNMAVTAN
jgi:SAM-dependent methyltransferase